MATKPDESKHPVVVAVAGRIGLHPATVARQSRVLWGRSLPREYDTRLAAAVSEQAAERRLVTAEMLRDIRERIAVDLGQELKAFEPRFPAT